MSAYNKKWRIVFVLRNGETERSVWYKEPMKRDVEDFLDDVINLKWISYVDDLNQYSALNMQDVTKIYIEFE